MQARETAQTPPRNNHRPLGTLFSRLVEQMATLFQQEVTLAKVETAEKVSQVGNGLAALVIGGLVLFAGLLKMLDAAIYGVGELLPPDLTRWLSALIVGAVVALIGLIMVQRGRRKLKPANLAPQRTLESLQRDQEFAKEHIRSTTVS